MVNQAESVEEKERSKVPSTSRLNLQNDPKRIRFEANHNETRSLRASIFKSSATTYTSPKHRPSSRLSSFSVLPPTARSRPPRGKDLSPMDLDTIPDFLAGQRDAAPADLQHLFLSFEDFWERKLWHQLTDALIEYFSNDESCPQRLPIYKSFILTFADKINQLKLVTLGLSASTQCRGKPGIQCVPSQNLINLVSVYR